MLYCITAVTAATAHHPASTHSERRTTATENEQAKSNSEAVSQPVVKRPMVKLNDIVNPELLR